MWFMVKLSSRLRNSSIHLRQYCIQPWRQALLLGPILFHCRSTRIYLSGMLQKGERADGDAEALPTAAQPLLEPERPRQRPPLAGKYTTYLTLQLILYRGLEASDSCANLCSCPGPGCKDIGFFFVAAQTQLVLFLFEICIRSWGRWPRRWRPVQEWGENGLHTLKSAWGHRRWTAGRHALKSYR